MLVTKNYTIRKIIFIVFLLFKISVYAEAISHLDSLEMQLQKTTDSKQKFNLLIELNGIWSNDYMKGVTYGMQAMEIANQLNDKSLVALAIRKVGNTYYNHSFYEKAISFYLSSMRIADDINDSLGKANCLNNIGNVYTRMAEVQSKQVYYLRALDFQTQALEIRKKINDFGSIKNSLLNLSNIYIGLEKYEMAIEYLNLALIEYVRENDLNGIELAYTNLASVYLKLFYKENKKYFFVKAKEYVSFLMKQEGSFYSASTLILNGEICYYEMRFKEATDCYLKAINIGQSSKNNDILENAALGLSKVFAAKNDFENALKYQKLYVDAKDSIFNQQSAKQIEEMDTKYESEKKEKEIEILVASNKLQGAEIDKQKLIRNGTIGGLFIALIFALVLLNRFKVTNSQKKIIEFQNSQIVESINYSKKIQDSLLPSVAFMQKSFRELFIFNSAKDIVSGDFYFFKEFQNKILIACADSTRHGVPGGFMSTLGGLLLDKITVEQELNPDYILNKFKTEIRKIFKQQSESSILDKISVSVCLVDKTTQELEFSGLRSSIIIINNNNAVLYDSNSKYASMQVVGDDALLKTNLKTEKIQLNNADWVYLFTDGFMEQVQVNTKSKMKISDFQKILVDLTDQPIEQKQTILMDKFNSWKGNQLQSDDLLIIGFKVS